MTVQFIIMVFTPTGENKVTKTLTESPVWEDAIFQLEKSTPVLGGDNGPDNWQAEQLANRTLFLKLLAESAMQVAMTTSATYDDVEKAQDAINKGIETHRFFTVRETDGVWSQRYENVNGVATPTGEKLLNADGVNFIVIGVRTDFDELVSSPRVMTAITAPGILSGEIDPAGRYSWVTRDSGAVDFQKLIINSKEVTLEDNTKLNEVLPFRFVTVGNSYALIDPAYRYALMVNDDGSVEVQKLRIDASKLFLSDHGETLNDVLSGLASVAPEYDYRLSNGTLRIYNRASKHWSIVSNDVEHAALIAGGIAYTRQNIDFVYETKKLASVLRYSKNRIICAGDSLTQGAGGSGESYPSTLAQLTGLTALNRGYAGRASADIALHLGALRPTVSVAGGQIPESGSVAITSLEPNSGWRLGQNNETFPGILAGVEGSLVRASNNTWSFTRSASGSPVPVSDDSEFICTEHAGENDSITISWVGRNNYATEFAEVERDTELFNEWIGVYNKQHIVIGMTTTSGEVIGSNNYNTITRINAALHETYGDCYVDILDYLVKHGLEDAGITPTAGDITDIQNGVIPRSLRSDDVHLNAAGYPVVGRRIYQQLITLGWV